MKTKKFFTRDMLFYIVMLALPVLQFCIFYIGVNGRSFMYSFQDIDSLGHVTWTTKTLTGAFKELTSPIYMQYIGNSFLVFALTYSISTVLALIFSYFIYKKLPGSNAFKVLLFMPSIISAIVISVIFFYFMNEAAPAIIKSLFGKKVDGFFDNKDTMFGTVLFYNIFVSFGTSVLMYSNAMSGISPEVIEAGKLDGASPMREFFSIVIPAIFPTITTFAITSVAAIFVNQFSLYSLYTTVSPDPSIKTIGYQLFVDTMTANGHESLYPRLSAMGLCFTVVAIPLTFTVKYLLEKYGPSEK